MPKIEALLKAGSNVLLDAILSEAELAYYERNAGIELQLIGIETDFDVRATRLRARGTRSLSQDELRKRDEIEVSTLEPIEF